MTKFHQPGAFCKLDSAWSYLILSMFDNEAYVLEALRVGVRGYVLKQGRENTLVEAIREVAAGRRFLSPLLPSIEAYTAKTAAAAYDRLTTRERETLQMAVQGMTTVSQHTNGGDPSIELAA